MSILGHAALRILELLASGVATLVGGVVVAVVCAVEVLAGLGLVALLIKGVCLFL